MKTPSTRYAQVTAVKKKKSVPQVEMELKCFNHNLSCLVDLSTHPHPHPTSSKVTALTQECVFWGLETIWEASVLELQTTREKSEMW